MSSKLIIHTDEGYYVHMGDARTGRDEALIGYLVHGPYELYNEALKIENSREHPFTLLVFTKAK